MPPSPLIAARPATMPAVAGVPPLPGNPAPGPARASARGARDLA